MLFLGSVRIEIEKAKKCWQPVRYLNKDIEEVDAL
jgi:hypothetical protein